MPIPCFPDFTDLGIDAKDELCSRLSLIPGGVSEFTFAGLYLFRNKYKYRVSKYGANGDIIISGEQPCRAVCEAGDRGKNFFMTPCGFSDRDMIKSLFETHCCWKNISESVLAQIHDKPEDSGLVIEEDRDNFDYLYLRKDMAELPGKKYHKKKNLINQFLSLYPNHEIKSISIDLVPHAAEILECWYSAKTQDTNDEGDYEAAKDALDNFEILNQRGIIVYIDGKAAAYCLGESIANGKMFTVQFEKAIETYKGIYQFINRAFAASLPEECIWLNREQDLGKEGLRHAKMSYRPCGYVKKYVASIKKKEKK
jgi:hypothetical protein